VCRHTRPRRARATDGETPPLGGGRSPEFDPGDSLDVPSFLRDE
jgi:hypothetical protein